MRSRILAASHTCVHSEGDFLYRRGERPTQLYFPISGMASMMYTSPTGSTVELENIGCEGLVGWLHLLGQQLPASDCVVRIPGRSFGVPFSFLQREFDASAAVHQRVLEFAQNQVIQARQLSACNRLHPAPARIARWLLLVTDCIGSDTVPVTQAGMAAILGTRRTTVTEVAGVLARAGTLEIRRGTVRILDEQALKANSCECYSILHNRLQIMYSEPDMEPATPEPAMFATA